MGQLGYPRAPTLRKLDTPLTVCDQPVPVYSISLLSRDSRENSRDSRENSRDSNDSRDSKNQNHNQVKLLLPFTPRNRLIIDNTLAKQLGVRPIDHLSSPHSHSHSHSHSQPTADHPLSQATPLLPRSAFYSNPNPNPNPNSSDSVQFPSRSSHPPPTCDPQIHSSPSLSLLPSRFVPTPSNHHMGFDLSPPLDLVDPLSSRPHPLIQVAIIAIASIWSYNNPLSPHLLPFISNIIKRSRSNQNTLKLSLFYLHQSRRAIRNAIAAANPPSINSLPPILSDDLANRIPKPSDHPVGSGRKMFLSALMCASKYLQDRNFSNRAWAKISGLPVHDINSNERVFLGLIDYRLHVDLHAFDIWSIRLQKLMDEKGITSPSSSHTSPTRSRPTSLPLSASAPGSAPLPLPEPAPKPLSEPHRAPPPARKVELDLCTPVRKQTHPVLARPSPMPISYLATRPPDHTPVRQMTTPRITRPSYGTSSAYQTPTKSGSGASSVTEIGGPGRTTSLASLGVQRRTESSVTRPVELASAEIAQAERKLHQTVAHEKSILAAANCTGAGAVEQRALAEKEEEVRAQIRRLVTQTHARQPEGPGAERRASVSAVEIAEALERARLDGAAMHRCEDSLGEPTSVRGTPWTRAGMATPTRRATQPAYGGSEPVPRIERRAMGGCGVQEWHSGRYGGCVSGREGYGQESRLGLASMGMGMGGRARSTVGGNSAGAGERPASASGRAAEQRAGTEDLYRAYLGQGRYDGQYQYQYPRSSLSSTSAAGSEYLGSYHQSQLAAAHERTPSQSYSQHHRYHQAQHHEQHVDQRLVVGGRYGF